MRDSDKLLTKKEAQDIKKKIHFFKILGYPCERLSIDGGVYTLVVCKPSVPKEFVPEGFFHSCPIIDKMPNLATVYYYEDERVRDLQYELGKEFYTNEKIKFKEKKPDTSLLSERDLIIMFKNEAKLSAERKHGFDVINILYKTVTSRMPKGEPEGMIAQDILL